MLKEIIIKKEIVNVSYSLVSLALTWLAPIKNTVEFVYSFSDHVIFGKLYNK